MHHPWLQTFCRRFHLQSHDTKQLATGFSNDGVTTHMTASTNMFHKMHLLRSACGRHASKIFASPAARASQGITLRRAQSVRHPSALREPSAASASSGRNGPLACLESRYQAFIASRNRIKICLDITSFGAKSACNYHHNCFCDAALRSCNECRL